MSKPSWATEWSTKSMPNIIYSEVRTESKNGNTEFPLEPVKVSRVKHIWPSKPKSQGPESSVN